MKSSDGQDERKPIDPLPDNSQDGEEDEDS